jgi:large conductance mechanosensitive channel
MSWIKEFKQFAVRGNVVDLAVGVIMGAAFSPIVKSLVEDIIMPPIGYLIKGVNFSDLAIYLPVAKDEYVKIGYGKFINASIAFLITAWAVFLLIKAMNAVSKPKEAAPAPLTKSEELLTEIRDLLKKQP